MKHLIKLGFVILLLAPIWGHAQSDTNTTTVRYNKLSMTALAGLHQFYGDISDNTFFPGSSMPGKYNWQVSGQTRYDFNEYFAVRGDISMGQIWAQKKETKNYFGAELRDMQTVFLINMTSLLAPKRYDKKWDVDLGFGLGYFGFATKYKTSTDSLIANIPMNYSTMWSINSVVSYKLSTHWALEGQITLKNTPLDLIDGVKNVYTELDKYSNVSIGVTYTFGRNNQGIRWNPEDQSKIKELEKALEMGNVVDDLGVTIEEVKKEIAEVKAQQAKSAPAQIEVIEKQQQEIAAKVEKIIQGQIPIAQRSFSAPSSTSIFFESNSSVLSNEGKNEIKKFLVSLPDTMIQISLVGYADVQADSTYNIWLSERRCQNVKSFFISCGVETSRIEIHPMGESPGGLSLNRRVDVILKR